MVSLNSKKLEERFHSELLVLREPHISSVIERGKPLLNGQPLEENSLLFSVRGSITDNKNVLSLSSLCFLAL